MAARTEAILSEDEYLALEREGDTKHEYHGGQIVAMVGASFRHSAIVSGTQFTLFRQLRGGACQVHSNDVRVRVGTSGLYTYPDLLVVCGEPQFSDERADTLLNPAVIIEVLSPSTENYDRGGKFRHYQTIPSLREYLLIAQDAPLIEHFARQADGRWLYAAADGLDTTLALPTIGGTLALADVYELVAWEG